MADSYVIADLPADQRPRERLLALGPDALTNAELIALLLGSGRRGVSSIDLARQLLCTHGGLSGLRAADAVALAREPGIGAAKATRLVAALALTKRVAVDDDPRVKVTRTSQIAALVAPRFVGARRERVVLLVCGTGHRLLDVIVLADGAAHAAAFPIREVLAEVLRRDGVAFALAHNHPGGDPTPSDADRKATVALRAAADGVGLRFLDHVVVAGHEWRSVR